MPELPNRYDDDEAVRLRAEQADPTVMYLVVRDTTTAAFSTLALDVARAVRNCRRDLRERWRTAFDTWEQGSFRKVTLRAKEKEWAALLESDHARAGDMLALPPRRKSERDKVLSKLQVYAKTSELPELTIGPGLNLAVNADVEMSGGKALAQIAHAALMMALDEDLEVHVGRVNRERWSELLATHHVAVVRDAGLTEVAAGSQTVMAFVGR